MATPLKDTLHLKTASQLYDMVESGWSSTIARVELARRGLPLTRPSQGKRRRARRTDEAGRPLPPTSQGMKAKRHGGVTSGYVDPSRITPMPKTTLPGQSIPPYI